MSSDNNEDGANGCGSCGGVDKDNIINTRKMYNNLGITVTVICVCASRRRAALVFVLVLYLSVNRRVEYTNSTPKMDKNDEAHSITA